MDAGMSILELEPFIVGVVERVSAVNGSFDAASTLSANHDTDMHVQCMAALHATSQMTNLTYTREKSVLQKLALPSRMTEWFAK